MSVLRAVGLDKTYAGGTHAVQDVSLDIERGECVGVVGESGSGKSTLARCVLTLESLNAGELWLGETPLHRLAGHPLRQARQRLQAVFQNPTTSFNSKVRVGDSLLEPIRCQRRKAPSFLPGDPTTDREVAEALLALVHLPAEHLDRLPRQLSGGERQRVAIARAISIEPELIVLDEPTASLDVSIQARVLNLLRDLQEELGLSYLFISHDLSAVQFMSRRILVMQDGVVVDRFERDGAFSSERHPYTRELVRLFDD